MAVQGASNDGGAKVLKVLLENPMSAMMLLGGGVSAVIIGTIAWVQVNSDLSKQAEQIKAVKEQVRVVDQKSSDKLDKLTSDISDMKVSLQRVVTSVEFLARQPSGLDRRP